MAAPAPPPLSAVAPLLAAFLERAGALSLGGLFGFTLVGLATHLWRALFAPRRLLSPPPPLPQPAAFAAPPMTPLSPARLPAPAPAPPIPPPPLLILPPEPDVDDWSELSLSPSSSASLSRQQQQQQRLRTRETTRRAASLAAAVATVQTAALAGGPGSLLRSPLRTASPASSPWARAKTVRGSAAAAAEAAAAEEATAASAAAVAAMPPSPSRDAVRRAVASRLLLRN